jgi:predicted solute-binding protein
MFAYPFVAGWTDAQGIDLVERVAPSRVEGTTLAVLDSVVALTLLQTHVIIRDIAIVVSRASFLTLETHARPDEIESATVSIGGVSPVGRAIATAILQPFYGINVTDWAEEPFAVDDAHATISEGPAALIPAEDEDHYQEDLGRAWFLMTDLPLPTHLCLAPRSLLARDPAAINAAVSRLLEARAAGESRGRELRRDLSNAHNLDRETLTETLAELAYTVTDDALNGLAELSRRSGLGISKNAIKTAAVAVRRG